MGVEPTIFALGKRRANHYATPASTLLFSLYAYCQLRIRMFVLVLTYFFRVDVNSELENHHEQDTQ